MAEKTGGAPGWLWIVWWAVAFGVFFVGGSAALEHLVIEPYCEDACADEGRSFERLRIGTRSGPPHACMCTGERAIETSLPDLGTFACAMLFLASCYAPALWAGASERRRKKQP